MNRVISGILWTVIVGFFCSSSAFAHEVKRVGPNGVNLGIAQHQHFKSPRRYGGTYRIGHGVVDENGNGIIIWSAKEWQGYGRSQTRQRHYRGGFSRPMPGYGRPAGRQYGRSRGSRNQ